MRLLDLMFRTDLKLKDYIESFGLSTARKLGPQCHARIISNIHQINVVGKLQIVLSSMEKDMLVMKLFL